VLRRDGKACYSLLWWLAKKTHIHSCVATAEATIPLLSGLFWMVLSNIKLFFLVLSLPTRPDGNGMGRSEAQRYLPVWATHKNGQREHALKRSPEPLSPKKIIIILDVGNFF